MVSGVTVEAHDTKARGFSLQMAQQAQEATRSSGLFRVVQHSAIMPRAFN